MCNQLEMKTDNEFDSIDFSLHGNLYVINCDTSRAPHRPRWYVQRMSDLRTTERYYSWPDGAFAAVFWSRCQWTD